MKFNQTKFIISLTIITFFLLLKSNISQANCTDNSMLNQHNTTVEQVQEKTNEITKYIDNDAVAQIHGIDTVEIAGSKLKFLIQGKTKHQEFTAPTVNIVQVTKYEAKPISTAIGTVILLGLPLLLAPGNTLEKTFGCVDRQVVKSEPDTSQKVPTKEFIWRESKKKVYQIKIEGLVREVQTSIEVDTNRVAEVDLKDLIMATELTGPTSIKISCTDCVRSDSSDTFSYPNLLASKEIVTDFRAIKNLENEKIAAIEREKREQLAKEIKEQELKDAKEKAEQRKIEIAIQQERRKKENAEKVRKQQGEQKKLELEKRKQVIGL